MVGRIATRVRTMFLCTEHVVEAVVVRIGCVTSDLRQSRLGGKSGGNHKIKSMIECDCECDCDKRVEKLRR